MDTREQVRVSKFLSLVLRHKPETVGLELDEAGWVSVADLLEKCDRYGKAITPKQLADVVENSDKKRFEFNEDGSMIRCCQGHSVPVDLGYPPVEPPEFLFHGTVGKRLGSIRKEGLLKGKRHHVHLSPDHATAIRV